MKGGGLDAQLMEFAVEEDCLGSEEIQFQKKIFLWAGLYGHPGDFPAPRGSAAAV